MKENWSWLEQELAENLVNNLLNDNIICRSKFKTRCFPNNFHFVENSICLICLKTVL